MIEMYDKICYAKWDDKDFVIPQEFFLGENSTIHDALRVFYAAGGYDFFQVVDPEKYASNWLDYIGNLYSEIEDRKYKSDGTHYDIPLSESERSLLIEQGVPKIFTTNY